MNDYTQIAMENKIAKRRGIQIGQVATDAQAKEIDSLVKSVAAELCQELDIEGLTFAKKLKQSQIPFGVGSCEPDGGDDDPCTGDGECVGTTYTGHCLNGQCVQCGSDANCSGQYPICGSNGRCAKIGNGVAPAAAYWISNRAASTICTCTVAVTGP